MNQSNEFIIGLLAMFFVPIICFILIKLLLTKKKKFIFLAILLYLTVVFSTAVFFNKNKTLNKNASPNKIESISKSVIPNSFSQAVNKAQEAANSSKSTNTISDWLQVSKLWNEAIKLMEEVPIGSSYYGMAQQKISEYELNREYAQKNAKILDFVPKERNSSEKWMFLSKSYNNGYIFVDLNSKIEDNTYGKSITVWTLLQINNTYEYVQIRVNCSQFGSTGRPVLIEVRDRKTGKILKQEDLSDYTHYPHPNDSNELYKNIC